MKKIYLILVFFLAITGCSSKNVFDKLYNQGVERVEDTESSVEVKDYYLKQLKDVYDKSDEFNEEEYNKKLSDIVLQYERCGSNINKALNHIWIHQYDKHNNSGGIVDGVYGFLLSDKDYKIDDDSISGRGRYYSSYVNGFIRYNIGYDCKISIKYDDNTAKGTFLDASSFKWVDNHLILDVDKLENKDVEKEKSRIQFKQADDEFNLSAEEDRIK